MKVKTNPIPSPQEHAKRALHLNTSAAYRILMVIEMLNADRPKEASEFFDMALSMLKENDAIIRTLADMAKDVEPLPVYYTPSNRCKWGAALRYPLVWNGTSKESGEHICADNDDCDQV